MTDSEAVRTALREAAARRRVRSALREEVRRLAADEAIARRCGSSGSSSSSWRHARRTEMVPGEVFRLLRAVERGLEQRGARYAVILQADEFLELSTTLVAPTSASARPASFRPTITLGGRETHVLVEQTTVVAPQRLGRSAGPRCGRVPRRRRSARPHPRHLKRRSDEYQLGDAPQSSA